jgi:ribosomal-protein-alanine N-acetyltransferase
MDGVGEAGELRTGRLLLRRWVPADLAAYADINANPRARRWYPGLEDRATSDASVRHFADHHARLGYTFWAVEVLESARGTSPFIGSTGLITPSFTPPFDHTDPIVEIGWRLHPDWWGLGLATEAARACLEYGFTTLGLTEILAYTVPPNLASQAVMQRLGMSYDGVFEHPNARGAWWGPHVLYRARPGQG